MASNKVITITRLGVVDRSGRYPMQHHTAKNKSVETIFYYYCSLTLTVLVRAKIGFAHIVK